MTWNKCPLCDTPFTLVTNKVNGVVVEMQVCTGKGKHGFFTEASSRKLDAL